MLHLSSIGEPGGREFSGSLRDTYATTTGYVRQRLGGVESKDEVLHQYRTMGNNEQKDRFAVTNKTQTRCLGGGCCLVGLVSLVQRRSQRTT